jgi:hypothetical protein
MAKALPIYDEPRPWLRLGLVLAGAAAVGALVFVLVRPSPVSPPSGSPVLPGTQEERPDTFSDAVLYDTTSLEPRLFAKPLPREPFKGQKRPPCIRYTEVELVGACWIPHKLKAPCPDVLYEHQGECYLPVASPRPPPQSLGQ